MHVRNALVEDDVAADSNHPVPVVKINRGADGDDLVQDIIDQGSTVNKPDILAVRQDAMEACGTIPAGDLRSRSRTREHIRDYGLRPQR